ncbi:hypothetical protein BT93_D1738 [Corymbia citriodora subsp. variegata]|nr:hypothetical protein BT93_D1738 [Corymbia citriodora subsp. variegata]
MAIPAGSSGRVYKTKLIRFRGSDRRIVLQEFDGPCSLVAILNQLLLRGKLDLDPKKDVFSQEELLSLLEQRLNDLIRDITNGTAGYNPNRLQNIWDAKKKLPSVATGIDVNIKFSSIEGFEFTPELEIFDALAIPLYHGCTVDPKDRNITKVIGSKKYNELLSESVGMTTQKIKEFMEASLTTYGRSRLRNDIKDGELCVLFHDRHFSTMFKYKGEVYLLASLEAFQDEPGYWKELGKVKEGDMYVSRNFEEHKMGYHGSTNSAAPAGSDTNSDYQLAISLQQQEYEQPQPQRNNVQQQSIGASRLNSGPQEYIGSIRHEAPAGSDMTSDEDLALFLELSQWEDDI